MKYDKYLIKKGKLDLLSSEMEYDLGSTTFNIIYLGSRELNSYKIQELYPIVINGGV